MAKNNNTDDRPVLCDIKKGYALVTLNRPERLNAFNSDMHHELRNILTEVDNNDGIRAVLITGAGRGFCAGQDLRDIDPTVCQHDLSEPIIEFYNPLIMQLKNIKKPKIAAINGVVAGAGIGLALACDMAVSANNAKFAMAFGKIGLVPDSGLTWFLVRLVGVTKAKALMLSNAVLTAEEAKDYGFVWHLCEPEELMSYAESLTKSLAFRARLATQLTIDAFEKAQNNTLIEQLNIEAMFQREAGYSTDFKEGIVAFLEKRPPVFHK